MRVPTVALLFAAIPALFGTLPAVAAEMNEDQARAKMEGAGYANVSDLHQANMGQWMADAEKDGRRAMIVLYPDGTVSPSEKVDVAPAKPAAPDAAAGQAKP